MIFQRSIKTVFAKSATLFVTYSEFAELQNYYVQSCTLFYWRLAWRRFFSFSRKVINTRIITTLYIVTSWHMDKSQLCAVSHPQRVHSFHLLGWFNHCYATVQSVA